MVRRAVWDREAVGSTPAASTIFMMFFQTLENQHPLTLVEYW